MTNDITVIIAALGGTALGGAITFATNWINKRSEERKQLNSLFVNAGIENWRDHIEIRNKEGGGTLPIESYIMHMAILSDVLLDPKKLNEKALIERLKKSDLLIKAYLKFDQDRRG